jgi:MoaA/NifB/PqqE/SkfB family radical SAM enzyme
MLKLQQIRRLHIELTTRCNARCPMCMRNYRGYDYNSGYPDCELSLEMFKKIVDSTLCNQIQQDVDLAASDFNGVIFNGNLGDFSNAKDAANIVAYLVQHNVKVMICTNGSVRAPDWWANLALPGVTIGFALDGLADTHSIYRQDTDWHRIIENAKAFIAAGGQATWRFIPFAHNRHQEAICKQMAIDLGFTKFENIFDGRDSGPVFDRKGNYSHSIGKQPPKDSPPQIRPLLDSHINWYDAKKIKHAKDTVVLDIQCIHKRYKEIYIAADGSVYPCCFLGFYPGQMHHPGNTELAQLIKENNALQFPLEHCLNWFDRVEQTWQMPSLAQGRTYQCISSCNNVKDQHDLS